ncbi:TonB-dependent receptor domain-containing protein [Pseudoalteromonas fenneropenaei]|uniref:TonB-dependent receptor domain-containing protein n=1 Tax=Pseudoalteromonas fenneropenaei TaxID=1737459 RepID=A0ABV7CFC3_9GAMM
MSNSKRMFRKAALCVAVCSSLAVFSTTALASNVDGELRGLITAKGNNQPVVGATIVITNEKNGYTKTIVVDQDGSFNLKTIPVGDYKVEVRKDGYQTESIEKLTIGVGKSSNLEVALTSGSVEVISVTGSRVATVDVTSSEASFNISAEELIRLPVPADITSVALLAPGVNLGDSRFIDAKGNSLASFGGASQAENVYYVNGLNMTNFRNGVGGATIPFLSYDSFQVKTGGYSAEFGRATGGVVSAVTKKGSNEFEFGIQHRQQFASLYGERPNSYFLSQDNCNDDGCAVNVGDLRLDNSRDEVGFYSTDIFASGAIIEDTLFFYGLYEFRKRETEQYVGVNSQFEETSDDDPYYLARLDWNINEDHTLMAWVYSDESTELTETFSTDANKNKAGIPTESSYDTGGKSWSVRYTGAITDDLSISAMAGSVEFTDTVSSPSGDCPVIYDNRSGAFVPKGCWNPSAFQIRKDSDERKQYRFDVDWFVNESHNLRFGIDLEKNTSQADTILSGNIYYLITSLNEGAKLPNGSTVAETGDYVRVRNYSNGGTFKINNSAYYVEDVWTINDRLTATIGLRWESFENLNADDVTFIEMKNQFAPRLGIAYDIFGDGEHKVFANLGRYHLPVASNTNVRLAGAELYTHDWYKLAGINGDDSPILGDKVGTTHEIQDGTAPLPDSVTDKNLEPMYQDEFILGYQGMINDDWSFAAKFTRRELGNVIDDGSMEYAFRQTTGVADDHFLLFNPGRPVTFIYDHDGDGVAETITFSPEQMGYPEAERSYNSLDLALEKAWDGVWMFKAAYTWAQSYGNAEGYVKSDNGQDDAGLTTDWDYPYLAEGAEGYLPNDRRHAIKLFGAYALADNLTVGFNASISSGRPMSAFGQGYYPDQDNYHYGQTYWVGSNFLKRGSLGRTPWVTNIDANIKYQLDDLVSGFAKSGYIALNIYNLFDANTVTRFYEDAEKDDAAFSVDPAFGSASSWQAPRRVELTFNLQF